MHDRGLLTHTKTAASTTRAVAAIATTCALFLCCGSPNAGSGREKPPNVIVYVVDTLRPDHLGVYGCERDTSPRLDEFAPDAVIFDEAYSPSSWTKPSTASILSGLYPLRHRAVGRTDVIRDDVRLLSQRLREAGYVTRGFVTNPNVLPLWGFDRGFASYEDLDSTGRETDADAVVDRVIRRLDERDRDAAFFFYIHTLDPHSPYEPPPPFDKRYSQNPTPKDLYDGEIAFGDEHFGRLVDRLKQDDLYDNTVLVFVSDHGEQFLEHGGRMHGHTLYQEVVRVPLLIKLPESEHAGRRVTAPVSVVDVMPTLLYLAGLSASPDLDGVNLLPRIRGEEIPEQPLYFDLALEWPDSVDLLRGIKLGRFKYIRRLQPNAEEMLFDLDRDPAEQSNLISTEVDQAARLRAVVDEHLAATASGVHLRLVNGPGQGKRICEGLLRTTGKFVGLSGWRLEPGDTAELSDEGTTLSLKWTLENYPHPTGGVPKWIIDEDGMAFDVEPKGTSFTIEALQDEQGKSCSLHLGPERSAAGPLPVSIDPTSPRFAIRDVAVLLDGEGPTGVPTGAYLAVVPDAKQPETIPEDVLERLRALGYLNVPE